jgi:hypothetical protein
LSINWDVVRLPNSEGKTENEEMKNQNETKTTEKLNGTI